MRLGALAITAVLVAAWSLVPAGEVYSPSASSAAVASAPAGIEITPVTIEESRRGGLAGTQPKWPIAPEMKVTINVTGDVPAKAARFGRVKVAEAVDNAGDALKELDGGAGKRQRDGLINITEYNRRGVGNGFALELRFVPPARKATRIARLAGTFVLVSGKPVDVTFKDVAAQVGTELNDPALAEAGLKVKIDQPKDATRAVALTVEGNLDLLQDAELLDAAGKPVRTSVEVRRRDDGTAALQLTAGAKLPDNVGVKLTILSEGRLYLVPFELKDLPLP